MDLSWCIMCDRHCIEDNLYCSESCRTQDIKQKDSVKAFVSPQSPYASPVASPLLDPFFSSFNHERRTSVTISKSVRSTNEVHIYPSPSSVSSIQFI